MQHPSALLEVERKFICNNYDAFVAFLSDQSFSAVEYVEEKDEYFIDEKGDFLEKKICLRIRTS